ncbi:MAG: UTP--glucose-1-phosphate uridylyltransferase [Cellvibrionaceae bacterium]|jgi:UTP--glucose-1-phosphate uridylyltransferase
MKIKKAIITAAGKLQRHLPLQTLIDRDGVEKPVLEILIEEALRAGITDIGVVIHPADGQAYRSIVSNHAGKLTFIPQDVQLGHGHAIYCAKAFINDEPFLHLVGDHLYVSRSEQGCAQHLVSIAEKEECTMSAVQAIRESQLPFYGAIGGNRIQNQADLYRVNAVLEKPTPTMAEQKLIVSGLRAGHYLCFFGMHVLTPSVMDILGKHVAEAGESGTVMLSDALAELSGREKYLALEKNDQRYDLGVKYGLLEAQLALALAGDDRDELLTKLIGLLAA